MLKKRFVSSLFVLLFVFGCSKAETTYPESEDVKEVDEAIDMEVVVEETLISSVVTYMGLSLFESPNKKVIDLLVAGEIVSHTGNKEKEGKTEFSEIITKEGTRGWAITSYIEENSRPGVLKPVESDDILLFNKNNDSTISEKQINPFRIIAVDNTLDDPEFSKITWNKLDTYNIYSRFVMNDDISFEEDDIEFAKIVTSYLASDNKDVRNELLYHLNKLTMVSPKYKSYLEKLKTNVEDVIGKDILEISAKYQENVSVFQGSGSLSLNDNPVILEKNEPFPYTALDYILLNTMFVNGAIELHFYNTSNISFATIPAEVAMIVDGNTFYIAVLDSLDLYPGESSVITLNNSTELNLDDTVMFILTFVNGKQIESTLITKEGDE